MIFVVTFEIMAIIRILNISIEILDTKRIKFHEYFN